MIFCYIIFYNIKISKYRMQHTSSTKRFRLSWLVACCLLLVRSLSAQPIPCDGAYYLFLVSSISSNTTSMYRVTMNAMTGLPAYELINSNIKHRVTSVGYSVIQQKIYALDYNTRQLLSIDAKGAVEVFPVPLYLDTTHLFLQERSIHPVTICWSSGGTKKRCETRYCFPSG